MALIKCPECGKNVSDKATVCIHCGYSLNNHSPKESKVKCPECGEEIPNNEKICPFCGYPIENEEEPLLKSKMKECPECHTSIPLDAKECPNCAYPFSRKHINFSSILKNKKIMYPIIGVFSVMLVIVILVLTVGNRDINKAIKSYKKDDVTAFNIAKTRLDDSEINEINGDLMQDIESVKANYISEKISYDEALTELDKIIKYSDPKHLTNYNETKTFVNNLEASRNAFKDAQDNEAAGQYTLAYDNYKRVIEEDSNYKEAQNKIDELKDTVCQDYVSKAEEYAQNGDYSDAISMLNKAHKYDETNDEISSKLNEYKQKQQEIKEQQESEAREKAKLYDGKIITTQNSETTFTKAELTDHIYPNSRSGYYTYYSVNATGVTWLDIKLQVKNTSAGILNLNDMIQDVQATYDGTFKYATYGLYYSTGSNIDTVYQYINNSIDPLQEVTLHLVIEVPVEAKTSGKSLEAEFVLDGEKQLLLFQ